MKNSLDLPICLTYDDVLLVPRHSNIAHRSDVSTKTYLSRHITLNIPFISANMDTVTESKMAIALAHLGGIGIIHRFMSIERQCEEIKKVKRHEGFVLDKPFTLLPGASLAQAKAEAEKNNVSSFMIVDKNDHVMGILTRRDMLFNDDPDIAVSKLMIPFSRMVYAKPEVTASEAKKLIKKNKIEKLPLINNLRHLKGLITSRSLEHFSLYPNSTKDKYDRLRVGGAIGVVGDYVERARMLLDAGADVLVVDVAHGHNEIVLDALKLIRKKYPNIDIIGGNVATPEATLDLIKLGVDAVKVGIGPGGLCTTRIVAGVGMPQFTAVKTCSEVAKKYKVPIIADGGTNFPGDLTKALAAGASSCMLAGWFAGTDESPGGIIFRNGLKYKVHRGAASFLAVSDRKIANHEITEDNKLNTVVPEGVEALVPYKGKVDEVIYQLLGALRSGMSYCNAVNINALWQNARFVRMTEAGFRESKSHNTFEMK